HHAAAISIIQVTPAYPPPAQRRLIMGFALAAGFMTQLDATIANVALPHMQASTSASREQIGWVLTSYIIMAAIFTPLSGWLASRFGKKRVLVLSVAGFTIASFLCGLATNFGQLVGFRLLQGMLGAALLPLTQATMIDINPPERHGPAMAIWGMGAVLGPILGPVLGGLLTEYLNWRWVFFINVPVGVIAFLGLIAVMEETDHGKRARFDMIGFASLAVAVGAFQLMLDRGQLLDWFDSTEIWIEALAAGFSFYLFLVHSLTTRNPFVDPRIFADRNYLFGSIFGFSLGLVAFGVMAISALMLANLMNYPIVTVGMVLAPRGLGTMAMMLLAGRMVMHVDLRHMLFAGMVCLSVSNFIMAGSSLQMDSWLIMSSGVIQGVGVGLMFVPITSVIFATLEPRYRYEGAALNSLIRNLGGAVGISILQTLSIRGEAVAHSQLVEHVRPDALALAWKMPWLEFATNRDLTLLEIEVGRQALMMSYVNAFWLLAIACAALAPLTLFVKPLRVK
ncbi:MAG: DHA2 family efflux MFS transporter permease subunit, partial [Novosphingobium sp.]